MLTKVVTLNLEEAAAVVGGALHAQRLREWIAHGDISPFFRGKKGKTWRHRLSCQQVLGIAAAMWLRVQPGKALLPLVRQGIAEYGELPYSAVLQLCQVKDAYGEESFAKVCPTPTLAELASKGSPSESETKRLLAFGQAIERLGAAVRRKLGMDNDRMKRAGKRV